MFWFKETAYLNELIKFQLEMMKITNFAMDSLKNGFLENEMNSIINLISVDYAGMEKSENISVIHSDIRWSDKGSFDALVDYFAEKNELDDKGTLQLFAIDLFPLLVFLK